MKSIWKAELTVTGEITVRVPKGAKALCVQVQRGKPCVWFVCETTAELEERKVYIYGTGHPLESPTGNYIGTFQLEGGALVFHAFADF